MHWGAPAAAIPDRSLVSRRAHTTGVSLSKGGNVSLTKEAPGLTAGTSFFSSDRVAVRGKSGPDSSSRTTAPLPRWYYPTDLLKE